MERSRNHEEHLHSYAGWRPRNCPPHSYLQHPLMWQNMWQTWGEKKPYGIRLKQTLFNCSCGRLCGKMSDFRSKASKKNTFLVNLNKKRTHQPFLIGEFVVAQDGFEPSTCRVWNINNLTQAPIKQWYFITKHLDISRHIWVWNTIIFYSTTLCTSFFLIPKSIFVC